MGRVGPNTGGFHGSARPKRGITRGRISALYLVFVGSSYARIHPRGTKSLSTIWGTKRDVDREVATGAANRQRFDNAGPGAFGCGPVGGRMLIIWGGHTTAQAPQPVQWSGLMRGSAVKRSPAMVTAS